MVLPAVVAAFLLPFLVLAHPTPNPDDSGFEFVGRSLPERWYHEPGHPVEKLFNRQNVPTDGVNYPAVGTPEWTAGYPSVPANPAGVPQEWTDALNEAVAAGKIPNIPPSSVNAATSQVTYPDGINPSDPSVCSATFGCFAPTDVWNGPDGVLAIGFDDGPTSGSALLYSFLGPNKIQATHFMIGGNILANPSLFLDAYQGLGGDIAVHTWSHPYMTSLPNANVIAELGWCMEIIKNSTGGRLPRYWRPPYGDVDDRVRAIAQYVFGLTTIIWNHDTLDWSLTTGGTTPEAVNASLTQWLTGPKSPGLIILEHELTNQSAQSFIDAWPLMSSTGWITKSTVQILGQGAYLNSKDSLSPVQYVSGVLGWMYTNLPSSSSILPTSTSTPPPSTTSNATSNTSQPDKNKNGSSRSFAPKFAGVISAILLTIALYAC